VSRHEQAQEKAVTTTRAANEPCGATPVRSHVVAKVRWEQRPAQLLQALRRRLEVCRQGTAVAGRYIAHRVPPAAGIDRARASRQTKTRETDYNALESRLHHAIRHRRVFRLSGRRLCSVTRI